MEEGDTRMARTLKQLPQRKEFIILTNGKATEKNYFKILRSLTISIFEIKIKFSNSDPVNLVDEAIQYKHRANQVWVVFDKDEFPDNAVISAMHSARLHSIGVAFSNAAFEVWLIDHFVELSQEKTAAELIPILDTYLKGSGYTKGYAKNDPDVIANVFIPRLTDAVHHADVSLQQRIAEYNPERPEVQDYPYFRWNSCTTIHRLIEALKLQTTSGAE